MADDRTARPEQDGASMLARISDEVVRAQKEHYGKGPDQAKAYMMDDIVLVVMRGGMTQAELTMLEFGHHDSVRNFRQVYENAMAGRLTGLVEAITGRTVLTYQSQVLFDPHVIVELFVLDDEPAEAIEATARDQLERAG